MSNVTSIISCPTINVVTTVITNIPTFLTNHTVNSITDTNVVAVTTLITFASFSTLITFTIVIIFPPVIDITSVLLSLSPALLSCSYNLWGVTFFVSFIPSVATFMTALLSLLQLLLMSTAANCYFWHLVKVIFLQLCITCPEHIFQGPKWHISVESETFARWLLTHLPKKWPLCNDTQKSQKAQQLPKSARKCKEGSIGSGGHNITYQCYYQKTSRDLMSPILENY